jgi:hypothetical protein
MKHQVHIDDFSSILKEILNNEITFGNEIVETSRGWPEKDTIIVFLKKPFIKNYKVENVDYRNIDDPHWWKAEYFDNSSKHILACKFE